MWGSSKLRYALIGALLLVGCRGTSPIEDVESERFAVTRPAVLELRALDRAFRDLSAVDPADRIAREALRDRAVALAEADPTWLAPRRLLDDLDRSALLGPWLYADHLNAWRTEGDADAAYLLGRLETGRAALARFEAAIEADPRHLWAWHGLAWETGAKSVDGRSARAFIASLQLIDDHQELMSVAMARVRRLETVARYKAAEQLVTDVMELPGWDPVDRQIWAATLLRLRLRAESDTLRVEIDDGQMSFKRTANPEATALWFDVLAMLDASSGLPDAEALTLVSAALAADVDRTRVAKLSAIQRALEGRDSTRAVRRRELMRKEIDGIVLGALIPPGPDGLGNLDPLEFDAARAFARGDLATWLTTWRERLPDFVRSASAAEHAGVWVRPAVARLVAEEGLADDPLALASALAEAGWFQAAGALLARWDGDAQLRARVDTGRETLAEWKRLWDATGSDGETLRGYLRRLQDLADAQGVEVTLGASPIEDHWGFAGLILPGPRLLPDATAAELPGLARWAADLGRLALLGHQGSATDGTLRSVIALEYIRGTHLGAPFDGTVFWCQGVDVPSRFERAGAPIAGAALHPGYWIDIEVVRDMWKLWSDLERSYAHLLEVPRPFPLPPASPRGDETAKVPLLGEGTRLSLAVMRAPEPVTFEDFLNHTKVHEEGHLIDRARFLPISKHWGRALRFLVEANFSVPRLMQRLEYRAELVAMCSIDDPRLALALVLDHVEVSEGEAGDALTPHASGYGRLLADLAELAAERVRAEGNWGGLREAAYLRWQWHRIEPEALRELALELARAEGLVES